MNKFNLLNVIFFIFLFNIQHMKTVLSENLEINNFTENIEVYSKKDRAGLKEIDLDNNGKINYYEFQQIRQRRFNRLDLNNDNIITQEEFELRNQKFFSEIDENNDENLSKLEMFKKRKKMRNILE